MSVPETKSVCSTCGSECRPRGEDHAWSEAEATLPVAQERTLLIGSLLFFLFPALLTFLGAWLGRSGGTSQLLGGLAGLLGGMGLARFLGPLLGPRTPSSHKDGA